MLRFVPPAGAPVAVRHLFRALAGTSSGEADRSRGLEAFRAFVGVQHVFGASSGRAALWLLLTALSELKPGRNVVVIPAYTCFSVPAAAVRARLRVLPVDVDLETLDYDFGQLEAAVSSGVLCILSCNLFGLPSDATRVSEVARSVGAFAVDDAAQALGAIRTGQQAGTRGDAGLYSLARGKALAASGGGLLVTSSDTIGEAIQRRVRDLPRPFAVQSPLLFLQNLATTAMIHPRLYWIPNSLPMLKLGVTEFDPGFPTESMPDFTQRLLPDLLASLPSLNETRRKNARQLISGLGKLSAFRSLQVSPDSEPVYIRLPLVASDFKSREAAVERLRSAGIGASRYYPGAISEIPGIREHLPERSLPCPAAEDLARRLITLPTHPLVDASDVQRMTEILAACSHALEGTASVGPAGAAVTPGGR